MSDAGPSPVGPAGSQSPLMSPNTRIDMAVNFMLPKGNQRRDDSNFMAIHAMDVKYVQTAISDMHEGDVLILLDIPLHKPNRTCSGGKYPFSYRLRFPSSTLRNCGFDLFPRLLDDSKYQARIRARLMAKEPIPDGIKYILDIGPSSDEDLHSSHLETLTLSRGVMRWYRTASVPPQTDKALVLGHDDSCECALRHHSPRISAPDVSWEPQELRRCLWDDDPDSGSPFRDPMEDYCEIRHTANVVRLLRRILGAAGRPGGGELILDSAPRVFTIAGLAKLFELNYSDQSTWLRNDIRTWFLTRKNSAIIEILAEDAIIVGYSVKIPEVTRAAYRILASEHALQIESSSSRRRGGHLSSVFGRPLRDINNDAIQTAIEHGGRALADRVLGTVARLLSDQVFDWLDLDEWRKFKLLEAKATRSVGAGPEVEEKTHGIRAILDACGALKEALLGFVRERVQDARCLDEEPTSATDSYTDNMRHFTPLSQRTGIPDVWGRPGSGRPWGFRFVWEALNDNQKALTSVFWKRLGRRWAAVPYARSVKHFEFVKLARNLNDALNDSGFGIRDYVPEYFDITRLFRQLETEVNGRICAHMWIAGSDDKYEPSQLHFDLSSHMLLGLNDDEMRFLPLWADGLNDDSGGVYDFDEVPPPMSGLGPSGPGPSFHTGQTVGTETTNSTVSDLGLGDMDIQSYTTETQTFQAHRGPSSVAAPSTGGPGASEDLDFEDARDAVPADHQPIISQAISQTPPHVVQAVNQTPRTSGPSPLTGANLHSLDDGDMQYIFGFSDEEEGLDSGTATPTGSATNTMEADSSSDSDWTMT
ncbi:hypothetical protein MAPG_05288 [Magnaporthiopsis poae ATCC 64411]|uniref:Uncharacterized protein n=1 Tax=Magnaporthiopsis poae (strain ATCC 64411 / 73-15) TaxID=644358 RepID=A0A0C4DZ01_MAGP6|nr:hypothetical protein MAPG_05288 [Magnaporthiopsis poae ATCC 64411]